MTSNPQFPHGFSCRCPTCAPIHKENEIRMLIDTCRRVSPDTIERRLAWENSLRREDFLACLADLLHSLGSCDVPEVQGNA